MIDWRSHDCKLNKENIAQKETPASRCRAKSTTVARAISMAEGAFALYTTGRSTCHLMTKIQAAEEANSTSWTRP